MALKPDVTLSIAKNARLDDDKPVKVYYRESVYRTAGESGDFREINQMGLEYMGRGDGETVEICDLAMRSLAAIDPAFVFAVSHMGALSALIESAGVTESMPIGPAFDPSITESQNASGSGETAVEPGAGSEAGPGTQLPETEALAETQPQTEAPANPMVEQGPAGPGM